jgi:Flp pilus assembly pilin Flp
MNRILRRMGRFHADERGQSTTEYVIILVGISVITIGLCLAFGQDLIRLFTAADSEVDQLDGVL